MAIRSSILAFLLTIQVAFGALAQTPTQPATASPTAPHMSHNEASLIGTTWVGTDSDGDYYEFYFQPDGMLHYQSPTGLWQNGTWKQSGQSIYIEMNQKYSEYNGQITNTHMQGTAKNQQGNRWTWAVKKK